MENLDKDNQLFMSHSQEIDYRHRVVLAYFLLVSALIFATGLFFSLVL